VKTLRWEWLPCLAIGIGLGLAYAWIVAPAPLAGSSPNQLRPDFKDAYRGAVASAYAATGDLQRAKARLELLKEPQPEQGLVAQAQRALSAGLPFDHAQDLARLASDLQSGTSSITPAQAELPPAAEPSPIPRPSATGILASSTPALVASASAPAPSPALTSSGTVSPPTRTPLPSPSAPFTRVSTRDICDPALPAGTLQIQVLDRSGDPFPGIEITITWSGGEERFFTGLQPELGAGYADYEMVSGTTYALQIARMGAPVTGVRAPSCPGPAGSSFVGSLEITFQAP